MTVGRLAAAKSAPRGQPIDHAFVATAPPRQGAPPARRAPRSRESLRFGGATPVLIASIDADERMTFVNETFRAVLGAPLDRIIGRTVAEVVGPALYAERSGPLRRALAGERVVFEIESKLGDAVRIVQPTHLPDAPPTAASPASTR